MSNNEPIDYTKILIVYSVRIVVLSIIITLCVTNVVLQKSISDIIFGRLMSNILRLVLPIVNLMIYYKSTVVERRYLYEVILWSYGSFIAELLSVYLN